MTTLNKKAAVRVLIFVLLLWGLMLAGIGYFNGNQAAVTLHLDQHKEEILNSKIDGHILNCWKSRNRSDFTLVLHQDQCDQAGINDAKCYNLEQLKDLKWVRKNLRGFKKTLIVGGNNFDETLHAAAMLAHYGYETRMLAGEFELAYNEPTKQKAASVVSDAVVVRPLAQSTDSMDKVEEEEEEGC